MKETCWYSLLQEEMKQEYFLELNQFIDKSYEKERIFPPKNQIYRAFELTDYHDVKVVILGQDPYHGLGQAEGLSFSVQNGVKLPPSLKNIYKELVDDLGCDLPLDGSLVAWAKEGVLLLNTVLTVPEKNPNGHKNKGWERFTDFVIQKLNEREKPLVFLLWGAPSQKKKALITSSQHCILESPHPSPLSSYRGFFGSKPFSRANTFLESTGQEGVDWCKVANKGQLKFEL